MLAARRLFTAALGKKKWRPTQCCVRHKTESRKEMMASMPVRDEGTSGERGADVDLLGGKGKDYFFPDENTPNVMFDGTRFADLPICHVQVSKNNTIMTLSDSAGKIMFTRSCGMEGFKHTRKGTNIAAQATAVSVSTRALDRGVKTIRVKVGGLGPGRMAAIKGLQMGGMNVVSVTDSTPISWNPPRARKVRRI